ncbi:MAG: NAD-dependent epimerase/dehydratase family protein [Thermodesulfobacteriota bacterium]
MSAFRGQRILVTGGAGFVGSNLVRALLEREPAAVVCVDNLLSSEEDNLPSHPKLEFWKGSVNDPDMLRAVKKGGFNHVFHLVTYHGNQSSIHDPLADHENNLLPTLNLCEALKDSPGLARVVYSSAGCTVAEKTYGDARATTEDAPVSLWMDSPYQISKVVGEMYFNYYYLRHGLPCVKARFQNVYGPGEVLGAGRWRGTPATVWRNVIPTFVYKAVKGMPLPVDNGGLATRDFIHVSDIARGLMACAEQGKAGEVYNLASGRETSILELARTINRLSGNAVPIDFKPARDWDRSGKRHGATGKAEAEMGFASRVDLEEGIGETIRWTRDNLERIESCIARHKAEMLAAGAA